MTTTKKQMDEVPFKYYQNESGTTLFKTNGVAVHGLVGIEYYSFGKDEFDADTYSHYDAIYHGTRNISENVIKKFKPIPYAKWKLVADWFKTTSKLFNN